MERTTATEAPGAGAAAVASEGGERPSVLVGSLVSVLAEVGPEGVTEAERIKAIGALEDLKAAAAAAQARLTAAAVSEREEAGEDSRSIRAEVALARRCSPTVADRHVGVAKALTNEMPHTLAALTAGEISEWRAQILVRETACLTVEDRSEVDARLAPKFAVLGDQALAAAARRIGAELDAESLALRHSKAVASRRVTVRPAPDGMAWLSVLGPLPEIIGAHSALAALEKRRHVIDPTLGTEEWEAAAAAARADSRRKGAWMADRALELLSGRAPGQPQPVAVNLVMTDRALLPAAFGGEVPQDDTATIPGWGVLPGSGARDLVRANLDQSGAGVDAPDPGGARSAGGHETEQTNPVPNSGSETSTQSVWLRRLFTSPNGHDLVALDSKRRLFQGGLRRFLDLRDPTCRIPWCDAPAVQADHLEPADSGGSTSAINGGGLCQRHNLVKEEVGWRLRATRTGLDGSGPHTISITSPSGLAFDATAPPILGEGWDESRSPSRARAPGDEAPGEFGPPGGLGPPDIGVRGAPGLDECDAEPPLPYPDELSVKVLPPLPDDPSAGRLDDWVPDESWFGVDVPWVA